VVDDLVERLCLLPADGTAWHRGVCENGFEIPLEDAAQLLAFALFVSIDFTELGIGCAGGRVCERTVLLIEAIDAGLHVFDELAAQGVRLTGEAEVLTVVFTVHIAQAAKAVVADGLVTLNLFVLGEGLVEINDLLHGGPPEVFKEGRKAAERRKACPSHGGAWSI